MKSSLFLFLLIVTSISFAAKTPFYYQVSKQGHCKLYSDGKDMDIVVDNIVCAPIKEYPLGTVIYYELIRDVCKIGINTVITEKNGDYCYRY